MKNTKMHLSCASLIMLQFIVKNSMSFLAFPFPWSNLQSMRFWPPLAFTTELWSINYNNIHKTLPAYDYVIVGSGNGGSVLASRLTEDPSITVLLLEAGDAEAPLVTDVPLAVPMLQSTSFNWNYSTQVQHKACLGIEIKFCATFNF